MSGFDMISFLICDTSALPAAARRESPLNSSTHIRMYTEYRISKHMYASMYVCMYVCMYAHTILKICNACNQATSMKYTLIVHTSVGKYVCIYHRYMRKTSMCG